MNNDNLKPFTKENAKEYGKKGGIESGKAKARIRTLKEQMKILLELPATDKEKAKGLINIGFDEADITNKFLLSFVLLEKALNGDIKAYDLIDKMMANSDKEKRNEYFGDLFD